VASDWKTGVREWKGEAGWKPRQDGDQREILRFAQDDKNLLFARNDRVPALAMVVGEMDEESAGAKRDLICG